MTAARFEIVRTDAAQPWHARFRAANGRIVWTTENYARRSGAANAVDVLRWTLGDSDIAPTREIDEREVTP